MIRHLPNIFTLLNLSAGFVSIISARIDIALVCLALSLFFDVLDGWVARLLNVQSDLGKELDSLADMVSFSVAPAYLCYNLIPTQIKSDYLLLAAACFYVSMAALRLARFNIMDSKPYFLGLATPAAAIMTIGLIVIHHLSLFEFSNLLLSFSLVFIGLLMNAPLRMFSLKGISNKMVLYMILILIIVGILFLSFLPSLTLTGVMIVYVLLSIVYHFLSTN